MGNAATGSCVAEGHQKSPDDELTPEELAYNRGSRHQRMNDFDRQDANFLFGGGRSGGGAQHGTFSAGGAGGYGGVFDACLAGG